MDGVVPDDSFRISVPRSPSGSRKDDTDLVKSRTQTRDIEGRERRPFLNVERIWIGVKTHREQSLERNTKMSQSSKNSIKV